MNDTQNVFHSRWNTSREEAAMSKYGKRQVFILHFVACVILLLVIRPSFARADGSDHSLHIFKTLLISLSFAAAAWVEWDGTKPQPNNK